MVGASGVGIVRSAVYFYSSVFRAAGKPSYRFGLYSLTAVLNVVGFLLVVRMGIVAVAISYVVVSYALMPLYFYLIQKLIHVTVLTHLKQYAPAFFASLVMVGTVLALKLVLKDSLPVIARLVILVAGGGLAYLAAIRLIRPPVSVPCMELEPLSFAEVV